MVKTPEEYFSAQNFDLSSKGDSNSLSASEKAFVEKYLGTAALSNLPVVNPEAAAVLPMADDKAPQQAKSTERSLRSQIRELASVQMVSFLVRGQIFLVPVIGIQEVLRYMPIVRLPQAPRFIAGVVNLRGRVTPLLHLDALLTESASYKYTPNSFIIICIANDLQLGLIVDRIDTMHFIEQEKIIWNAEPQLGSSAEFLCGIVDINTKVCGILDAEKISQQVLVAQ